MHQSIPAAPPPPPPLPLSPSGLLRGICPPCQSRESGRAILHCPGDGLLPTRGQSRAFDTHTVSYQNITTQKVLLEKKQIGSSVKDRNKLKRVVKAFSRFYAYISSLLHYIAQTGAIDVNQRFWLLNQISVDMI